MTNRGPRFNGARYGWTGYTSNYSYNDYKWANAVQAENVDFRNCVQYNANGSCYGGPGGGQINIVNNYYKQGPSGNGNYNRITTISVSTSGNSDSKHPEHYEMTSRYYISGNTVQSMTGSPVLNRDWSGVTYDSGTYQSGSDRYSADPNNLYGDGIEHKTLSGKSCVRIRLDEDESDRTRIILQDLQNGNRIDASYGFDQFATNFVWSEDSKYLYFTSVQHALTQIYALDVEQTAKYAVNAQKSSGAAGFLGGTPEAIRCLTAGVHDYHAVTVAGKDKMLGVRMSMSAPDDIYSIDLAQRDENGFCEQTQVSFINSDILEQLHIAEVEGRWMTTTDNKQMLTWVIYPPHFDPNKKYPALLYCQGGPQSTVSQFWSYRWNMQIMAANG